MSFRTNPDRILEHIDRQRDREEEGRDEYARDASARELGTEVPDSDATPGERVRRIFGLIEKAYRATASGPEMRRLAQRFQTVGDISNHHARGDVSVTVSYLDRDRLDDVGLTPFEIFPSRLDEARKVSKTNRPDANALRVLREDLRAGVMGAYRKLEPRLRDAVRERADIGHVSVRVTIDLRPTG
jgi:hypothetical protein